MARGVIWIKSVRPSVLKFSWNWLFSFFSGTQHGVMGHVVLCMTQIFWKKMFYLQNGENRPSPGFFKCIGKLFFLSSFLSVWSIVKVYIAVILVCLNKFFHIWENSGIWDMAQNALGQPDAGFFNHRTLKLAVSHKEINEINWFLVCSSISFLRNGSLTFSDFWHNGR